MDDTRRSPLERYWLAIIAIAVVLVYASLLRSAPLIWDDDLNIFDNVFYQTGTWWKLWKGPYFGMYIPVTSMIWGTLFDLGHGAAWPFRVLNLVLHLANVTLFAALLSGRLRAWNLNSPVAVATGVAIFALHPQQTAVVSWISGGRDLAATFFALSALYVYRSDNRRRMAWSTLLFACALLSKPSVVTFPLALIAWSIDRQRIRPAVWTAAIWLLMGAVSVLITHQAQSEMFSVIVPLSHRPLIALDALGFYLMKLAWPFPLAADYGRRPDVVWAAPSMMKWTILVALAATALLVFAVKRDRRYRVVLVWVVLMLPVLGLVTFAYQRISTVADHYMYLPLTALAAAAALAVAKSPRLNGRGGWALFGAILAVYGVTSWIRTGDWKTNQRFFEDMMAKNPRSSTAVINIAAVQCEKGNWQLGLATIQGTRVVAHTDAAYLANETFCLFRARRYGDVFAREKQLRQPTIVASLDSNPEASAVLANAFAGAYLAEDHPLRAFAYLCQAAAVQPQNLDIAHNVEMAMKELGRRGRVVTCRGKVRWDLLQQIVTVLN
jgi:hypothetical protein